MIAAWRGYIAGAAVLVASNVAAAQARVSIAPFTGQHVDEASQIVASALTEHAGEIEYVNDAAFGAAATRLGVQGSTNESDIARVARELRLDVTVVGDLSRRGRREWLLRVRVLRGRDGSTLGTTSWELRSLEELSTVQPEIWPQIRNWIRVDVDRGTAPVTNAPSPAPTTTEPPPPANTAPVARTPGLALAYVTAGGGMGTRAWRMPVLGDLSPRGYENNGFIEGTAEAALYYRFGHNRVGIGASGGVVFPISLASRGIDASGNVVSLATTMIEAWGGISTAYRPPAGGLFRMDVGIVAHSFGINTMALPIEQQLAPVTYTGVRASAEGIAPLYASSGFEFGAVFGTELRVVAIGSEVRAAFGESPGTTVGLGGLAGLQFRLDGLLSGLAVRLTGSFLRYRTAFSGRSDIGTGSDSVDDFARIHLSIVYGILTAR